jgi:hypothetical protein
MTEESIWNRIEDDTPIEVEDVGYGSEYDYRLVYPAFDAANPSETAIELFIKDAASCSSHGIGRFGDAHVIVQAGYTRQGTHQTFLKTESDAALLNDFIDAYQTRHPDYSPDGLLFRPLEDIYNLQDDAGVLSDPQHCEEQMMQGIAAKAVPVLYGADHIGGYTSVEFDSLRSFPHARGCASKIVSDFATSEQRDFAMSLFNDMETENRVSALARGKYGMEIIGIVNPSKDDIEDIVGALSVSQKAADALCPGSAFGREIALANKLDILNRSIADAYGPIADRFLNGEISSFEAADEMPEEVSESLRIAMLRSNMADSFALPDSLSSLYRESDTARVAEARREASRSEASSNAPYLEFGYGFETVCAESSPRAIVNFARYAEPNQALKAIASFDSPQASAAARPEGFSVSELANAFAERGLALDWASRVGDSGTRVLCNHILAARNQSLPEWVSENPDRCGLEENRQTPLHMLPVRAFDGNRGESVLDANSASLDRDAPDLLDQIEAEWRNPGSRAPSHHQSISDKSKKNR